MDESTDNKHLRWLLTVAVVGGLALLLVWWVRRSPADDPTVLLPVAGTYPTGTVRDAPTTAPQIAVDVVGAVVRPGVYYLKEGARIEDAVNAAGGYAPDANREAVNASIRLKDEQQIRVPRVAELAAAAPVPAAQVSTDQADLVVAPEVQVEQPDAPVGAPDLPAAPEEVSEVPDSSVASGPLDINRADALALETLPEIGPVIAQRIVDHRAAHGPFERIEQLQDIPGIGPATFDAIRDLVTVNP